MIELLPDFDAEYEFLGNSGDLFYFKTDIDAPLCKIIAIDLRRPEKQHWTDVVAEATNTLIAATIVSRRFVVED